MRAGIGNTALPDVQHPERGAHPDGQGNFTDAWGTATAAWPAG
jgi:hypothetical protein